jgi:hypothetical protein
MTSIRKRRRQIARLAKGPSFRLSAKAFKLRLESILFPEGDFLEMVAKPTPLPPNGD